MVRFRVSIDGVEETARYLREVGGRLSGSETLSPVLSIIGEDWSSTMQDNIREGNLDLPEMHASTLAIRRHYGHENAARLVRGGDLLHSIRVLGSGEDFVEVGSDDDSARLLQSGGQTIGPHGKPVELKPHPFIVASDEMIDDATRLVADYALEGSL